MLLRQLKSLFSNNAAWQCIVFNMEQKSLQVFHPCHTLGIFFLVLLDLHIFKFRYCTVAWRQYLSMLENEANIQSHNSDIILENEASILSHNSNIVLGNVAIVHVYNPNTGIVILYREMKPALYYRYCIGEWRISKLTFLNWQLFHICYCQISNTQKDFILTAYGLLNGPHLLWIKDRFCFWLPCHVLIFNRKTVNYHWLNYIWIIAIKMMVDMWLHLNGTQYK